MNEDATEAQPLAAAGAARTWQRLSMAVTGGVALMIAGVLVGLTMALRRREIQCPDGTYFPEGETDFRCFAHPQALDGTAVVIISLMVGILIVICGEIARAILTSARGAEKA